MSDLQDKKPKHFIAVNTLSADAVPFECPVCKFLMKDIADSLAYKEYCCCNICANKWAIPMKESWLAGTRPTETQIDQHREERLMYPSYQVRVDNNN